MVRSVTIYGIDDYLGNRQHRQRKQGNNQAHTDVRDYYSRRRFPHHSEYWQSVAQRGEAVFPARYRIGYLWLQLFIPEKFVPEKSRFISVLSLATTYTLSWQQKPQKCSAGPPYITCPRMKASRINCRIRPSSGTITNAATSSIYASIVPRERKVQAACFVVFRCAGCWPQSVVSSLAL